MGVLANLAFVALAASPAQETQIDGLRLLEQERRHKALDLRIGYVENDTRPGGGRYFCGRMSQAESLAAGKVISAALSRMPDTAIGKIRLRYVILCSRALAAGQRIGGIPVPPLDLLMVDAGDRGGLEHLFLHELFHLVEFRFGTYQDAEWQRRFRSGYANSYAASLVQSRIGSGRRGFLNAYGETFAHEERAELFAVLLLDPAGLAAHLKASNDALLRDKMLYLIAKCERLLGMAGCRPL